MNKWLKRLVSVLACAMLFTVFAACDEQSETNVTLVDFPAERSETVYLGDSYTLGATTVSDTEGNTYRVTYEVTRSDGEEVLVIGGEFDIEFLGGYTIVYTAEVGDAEQTSTVSLTVVDNESPLIRISSPSDGTVGSVYTLPQIVVSDLSGNITEQSIKVYLTESNEEQTLTETDGTYTFTPQAVGEYRIVVYAKDAAGNEDEAEASFFVQEVFAPEVIFDPADAFAASRITASQSVKIEQVLAEENGRDYISVVYEDPGQQWVNLTLDPVHDIASYEEYDYISVWMYAAAKEGTVYFSFFNSLDYQVTFRANEWYEAVLPMEAFIQAAESGTTFLPVNFHSPNSPNHQLLTEFRIGAVTAKNAAEFSVGVNVEETVSGNAETTLTVTSDAAALPEHSLTVREKNGGTEMQPTASEGGVYTYSLPAGTYSYELVCTDDGYIADGVTGEFVVENLAVQIELPEITQEYRAGGTLTIPDAEVLIGGEPSGETASYTAEYTYAATGETEEVEGTEFMPKSSGTLVISYSYENAVSKQLTIEVARAVAPENVAADLRNQDALLDFAFKGNASGTSRLSYVEQEGDEPAYLSWTTTDNAKASWVFFYMKNPLTAAEAEGYDFVKITVKAMVGENSKYRWRLLLLNDKVLIGDQNDWYDPERLPTEEWCDIYIPVDVFVENCGSSIICLTLNAPGDGNADDINEVRFAGFELVKSAGVEIEVAEHENTVYTGTALSIPAASLVTEGGEPTEGAVSVQAYSYVPKQSLTAVEDGYVPASAAEKIVILYTYPTAETVRVDLEVRIGGEIPADEILNAGKSYATDQLSASAGVSITQGNDGERDYLSVTYGSQAWVNIFLTPSNELSSYADYDYVSVWLYAVADEGEVKFSFFNNLAYQVTFNANEWYEARISMDVFIAQMEAEKQFLPVNFNNAKSDNHKSLTEIRFGDITAVRSDTESGTEA